MPLVVMDCGSDYTKIGQIDESEDEQEPGRHLTQKQKGVNHLVKHGRFHNFEAITTFWESVMSHLSIETADSSLLMARSLGMAQDEKAKVVEIAFETLKVADFDMESTATLCANLTDDATGVFVDIGGGCTDIQCLYKGYAIAPSAVHSRLSGRGVTKCLQHMIAKRQNVWCNDFTRLNYIKHKHGFVPARNAISQHKPITEGKIKVVADELARAGNFLFQPHSFSCSTESIQELIMKSIAACEPAMRKALCKNVYISGGAAQMQNFKTRLQSELHEMDKSAGFQVKNFHSQNHTVIVQDAVWTGGAIFALTTYDSRCVSRQEYAECGAEQISARFV